DIPTFQPAIDTASKNDPPLKNFDPGPPDDRPLPIDVNAPLEFVGSLSRADVPDDVSTPDAPDSLPSGTENPETRSHAQPFSLGDLGPGPKASSTLYGGDGTSSNPYGIRPAIGVPRTGPRRLGPPGPTATTERAVTAAIYWLARHQSRDGSWS